MNTMHHIRAVEIDAMTDSTIRALALAELDDDIINWQVVRDAADADREVRTNLQEQIAAARPRSSGMPCRRCLRRGTSG